MWYRIGTISVTQGSATVAGAGTAWVANVRVGDGLQGPDGRLYEITNVASNGALSIDPVFLGPSASAQSYWIVPVQGYVKQLADRAAALIAAYEDFQTQLDTKAPLASPALTGNATAPTPPVGNNSTRIQTTAGAIAQMGAFGLGANGIRLNGPLSSDVNVLDRYEEGTWTPMLISASGELTFSSAGYYTRIGDMVYVQGRIELSNKGTAAGNIRFGNIPFSTVGTNIYQGFIPVGFIGGVVATNCSGFVLQPTTASTIMSIYLRTTTNATDRLMTIGDFDDTFRFHFSGQYRV